ncbi:MAG: Dps family protein [Spirochaetota bacterium]
MATTTRVEIKAEPVVAHLNHYLADLHVAYGRLHSFHWNVEGTSFFELHAKLEEFYDAVATEIDEIAERVLMLGGRPVSTLREYVETSELNEAPARAYSGEEVARLVLDDFRYLIERNREGIEAAERSGDAGTADLLTASLRHYEKQVWMLTAFLG